jgi:outer membrane murein-binding lipoprotein Lpp
LSFLKPKYETEKKNTPPQTSVVGELIIEPINKTLLEENERLKTEIEVLKGREIGKQELVDEYEIRSKFLEDENQRSNDENQRLRDENQRFKNEVSSLKEKVARLDNDLLKERELCKRELMEEYEAKFKSVEEENQRAKGEIQAAKDENQRLRDEVSFLKEKEARLDILLSKEREEVGKEELMDGYKAKSKSMEEENQRAKGEIQAAKDENLRFRDEVSSLKEKEIRLIAENEYLKRREEEHRLERNTERARWTVDDETQRIRDEVSSLKEKEIRLTVENEFLKRRDEQLVSENEYLKRREEELCLDRTAERAMLQTMMSSLLNSGIEDRKRRGMTMMQPSKIVIINVLLYSLFLITLKKIFLLSRPESKRA